MKMTGEDDFVGLRIMYHILDLPRLGIWMRRTLKKKKKINDRIPAVRHWEGTFDFGHKALWSGFDSTVAALPQSLTSTGHAMPTKRKIIQNAIYLRMPWI